MITMSSSEKSKPADPVILIVEDNRVNQMLLLKKFEKQGWTSVLLAENGQKALDLALEKNPQLVLMDIQLPDMNGNAVISKLRDSKFSGQIVALSADALPEDRERSLAAGADGYITKPIDFTVFFTQIDGYLQKGGEGHHTGPADLFSGKIGPDISDAAKNIFISDGREKLLILATALAHADDEEHLAKIKAIAHEYKGNAGYFGLQELERIARELDMGFSSEEPQERLIQLTRQLVAAVQGIIHESA